MLPETGKDEDFRDAVINQLPIWELIDRLVADGITVHRYAYRPGWVTLEISWYMAHEVWHHEAPASMIEEIVKEHASDQGYIFNHWVLVVPKKELWIDTLETKSKGAKVFLRTYAIGGDDELELQQMIKKKSEVNRNILAKSFEIMDEEGLNDH